ncbi:MAG: hypothetical protein EXX96DRAFT_607327 [Benjaminiella poitrasii]|nr:MAG: hypothetical protein EXX96DRAFT_607327 [Benjaminiella poitrasii]
MRFSAHSRKNIENVSRQSVLRRDARAIIEDNLLHNTRNSFIHYDDIYKIYAKVMKKLFKFDKNDMSSIQKWCDKLENDGCRILRHYSEHMYYYGFQFEWQKTLMLQSVVFSMDAIQGIASRSRDSFYTLIVRNPKNHFGNAVAYLITNDHSVEPIETWLASFNQRNVMIPSQITVDCSIPEIDATRVVFGDSRNLLINVKTASTTTDETVKQAVKRTRGLMIAELKTIMYAVDPTAVKQNMEGFRNRWIHTQREFVNYFIDIWVITFGRENWTAEFMQEAFNYMRTNNYIESWHNRLRFKYLKRIKSRRLDRLMYILYVDRVELEVGRMGPTVRQRRRRDMLADKIPAYERDRMVEQIRVIDGEIRSCEFRDFKYRRKACKHMFLLKLHNRSLKMFAEEAQQLQTVAIEHVTNTNTIEPAEISAEEHTFYRKGRSKLFGLDHLRRCKRRFNNINEEETLDDIHKMINNFMDKIDRKD